MITAMVLTYNNEELILRALSCLWKFDEVLVIDNGSTDKTFERATSTGATIKKFPLLENFSVRRNEASKISKNKHIFWLDTDEVINPDIYDEMLEIFNKDDNALIRMKRLNCFTLHSYVKEWYPDLQSRAYNKERCIYQNRVHNVLQTRGCKCYESKYHILHGLFYNERRYEKNNLHLLKIRKAQSGKDEYLEMIRRSRAKPCGQIKNIKGVR